MIPDVIDMYMILVVNKYVYYMILVVKRYVLDMIPDVIDMYKI